MTRRLLLLATAALLAAGCAPDHGTVTRTWSSYSSGKWTYTLCAKDDKGAEGCETVPVGTFIACHAGDRWPDCQDWRRP